MSKLSEITKIPLVLHGGPGIKQESVLDAIQNGITKINVGTALRQAYERELKEKRDIRFSQKAVRQEMENLIKNYYRIQGGATKLAAILK